MLQLLPCVQNKTWEFETWMSKKLHGDCSMVSFWTAENPGFQGFETWKLGFSKSRMDNTLQANAATGVQAYSVFAYSRDSC